VTEAAVATAEIPPFTPRPRWHGLTPWLPLIFGAVLALSYLEYARTHVLLALQNAAFGRETAVFSGAAADREQCEGASDSAKCVASWKAAGEPPVILWFGNSQLMGINRVKKGDVNAPAQLAARLKQRGYRVVTYAMPNANLSEQDIEFDAIAPVYKPKVFLMPVCFDDIRELQIRDDIAAFKGDPAQVQRADADTPKAAEPGKVATSATVQARVEGKVTDWLKAHWPLWDARDGLRGTAGFAIHALRNQLLGIHSTSKRPVDPGLLRDRMKLLDGMLARARAQGMQVLLYVPPYRQDMDGPYVAEQYAAFKAELKAMADKHGARYTDLTPIVPGPEWATVTDDLFGFQEPDFMHFTADGHKRLTDAMDEQLRAMGY
jgi:hypothetical protein